MASCLLMAGAAQAQDKPKSERAEAARENHVDKAAAHAERAGSELKQAGKAATDEAQEALRAAREQASETMREARQGADEALANARKQAASSAEEAERVAKEAREQARTGIEQAREKAVSFFDEAREHVRRALLDAASSLESEERKTERVSEKAEREKARTQRQDVARVQQWRSLREQLDATRTTAADGSQRVDPAITEELRVHARRTARLARIRALADKADDERSVSRADVLLAKELERHEQAMTTLLSQAETTDQSARVKGASREESKP